VGKEDNELRRVVSRLGSATKIARRVIEGLDNGLFHAKHLSAHFSPSGREGIFFLDLSAFLLRRYPSSSPKYP